MASVRKRSSRNVSAPPPGKTAKKSSSRSVPENLGVVWNSRDCAPQLNISRDGLFVTGDKGYRMVRANAGAREGHWYFEIEILQPTSDEPAHVRVGWAAATAEIQAPVGYDQWSYAYRDLAGSKLHKSERYDCFGESFGPGDVIGCAIHLPPNSGVIGGLDIVGGLFAGGTTGPGNDSSNSSSSGITLPESSSCKSKPNCQSDFPPEFAHLPTSAHVRFYKNGVDQGVAYEGIPARTYYPAVSLYGPAKVRGNFGPVWLVAPPGVRSHLGAPGSSKGAGVGGAGSGFPSLSVSYSLSSVSSARPEIAGVPTMRPISDLKPVPKPEATEQAQIITQRRAHLNVSTQMGDQVA